MTDNIRQVQYAPRSFCLSDFQKIRTIGTGSFGRVYLARETTNGQYCALKVIRKRAIIEQKQVQHIRSERAILVQIMHPFIVNLWGTFQDTNNVYFVMDYVPGGELFGLLRQRQCFLEDTARFYAAETLLAIDYLHSKDIVYRDLKPENLLLDLQGHIKVVDFGFAKHVRDVTWTLCGTPDYLAPEIILCRGYGKSVDYWSLGVLIFEMLAGYSPFYDQDPLVMYQKILASDIQYPAHFNTAVHDLLSRLLTSDLSRRLGQLEQGSLDVMGHSWFAPIDFTMLVDRKIRPPFIPILQHPGDSHYFDLYDQDDRSSFADSYLLSEHYDGYFQDF